MKWNFKKLFVAKTKKIMKKTVKILPYKTIYKKFRLKFHLEKKI